MRGRCAEIEPISFDETVTIAREYNSCHKYYEFYNCILIDTSLEKRCYYYSVDNKKIISKLVG